MPFRTDHSWTPSTYRRALAAYLANTPKTDGPLMPRKASAESPRHAGLSDQLQGLMVWKAASHADDPLATSWMRHDLGAANDNFDDAGEPEPAMLDSASEIRPSVNEMMRAVEPKNGGKVIVCHDTQPRVPEYAASVVETEDMADVPRRDRCVVTQIGGLAFSNGVVEERCTVYRFGKPAIGRVRMPAGALVKWERGKYWCATSEGYRSAKGGLPETEHTVGIGGHNPGAHPFSDTFADTEWSKDLRDSVDAETAKVLDLAIIAANFREVGEALGKKGKMAERAGKAAVVDACAKLDRVLAAANAGGPVKVAA